MREDICPSLMLFILVYAEAPASAMVEAGASTYINLTQYRLWDIIIRPPPCCKGHSYANRTRHRVLFIMTCKGNVVAMFYEGLTQFLIEENAL